MLYICTIDYTNMRNKHNKEDLEKAIIISTNWADVCRLLNVKPSTGAQSHLMKRAKDFGIDNPAHFLGKGSNKGKTFEKRNALEYCFKGSKEISHRLKNKLIRDGYKKEECELCGISEWRGVKTVLELDHIDSDHTNNEFSNLQILCPNCHALETRNRRKK